jgi:HAMP domain-containing protein
VIREVPSRLAARQAAALGDLGPVSLTFSDNPAVSVLIDGRPWWLASRGRQVVADIHLRAAIRRAAGLSDLPIIIDNVQDVGGQPIPRIPGPVLILRTTDETGISIQQLATTTPQTDSSTGQGD